MHLIKMETLDRGSVPFVPDSTYRSISPQVLPYFLATRSWVKMGILDTLLSWFNRVVIIISVLCVALTLTAKQNDIPLSKASLRLCHLLSFSAWFGTSVWVSFIAGIVLIRAIDMDTFGRVQSKLFPAYFRFSFVCLAVTGFTGTALAAHNNTGVMGGATIFLVALGSVVANLLFFEPQTTTTMMERRRICKELGVDRKSAHPQVRQLSRRFGMFHGMSNLLNLAALCCGAVHLGRLAGSLDI